MAGNAFTFGVKPGGLTDRSQVSILLCYLIRTAAPLCRQDIENALLGEQLVNYFEPTSWVLTCYPAAYGKPPSAR